MQLKQFALLAAVLARVSAAPSPDFNNNDVDIEARDFSGESLNELDVREEEDLEARTYRPTCKGSNVELKLVNYKYECVCKRHGEVYNKYKGCKCPHGEEYSSKYSKCIPECSYGKEYNPISGKCETPFSCKGRNVEIYTDSYGAKSCKCKLTGQVYDEHKGCQCPHGEEYSSKYSKCIPECEYGYDYNPISGKCEKPFSCKGRNVEISTDSYGTKTCKCKLTGQVYDEHKGCQCPHGEEYSSKYSKCIPECEYGYDYNPISGKCEKPFSCKGRNVEISTDSYGTKTCKCKLTGQVYDEHKGCQCPHGESYSSKYSKCIPECSYGTEYDGTYCKPKCKGSNVIFKHHECKCTKSGEYYDEHYGCKDRCPSANDYWNGHKCVCKHGYYSYKGKCVKPETCIGYGSYFDKSKWECRCSKYGYKYVAHKGCVKECGSHETWTGYKCECEHGYVSKHGKCVKPPTCKGEGSYFDKSKWECRCRKSGYEYTKHGCKKEEGYGYGY